MILVTVLFIASAMLSILAPKAVFAAEWYVDASVSQSGDGASWPTAFKKIQQGINAAADGDTVTVAKGTYQENIEFKGKNIILTGTNPLDPDVIAKTIIQGQQLGPTVTFSGTEKASCWLSGFMVWDGKAENGGAILGNDTHATIGLNIITGGTADKYGGGLYKCQGLIHLNVITINSAGLGGGGLAFCNGPIQFNVISLCWSHDGGALCQCHGAIQHNTIRGNSADPTSGFGGGLYNCDGIIGGNTVRENSAAHGGGLDSCDGPIQNNTIILNSAELMGGGGLHACDGAIRNNLISGNSTKDVGGGLCGCPGTIENNTIRTNSARWGGGLCYCDGFIQNNLIAGNRGYADAGAGGFGGGLGSCDGTIRNNTITGNAADLGGGGLEYCQGTIRNCIIWGNNAPNTAQLHPSFTPTYSCIQGWIVGGEGNTNLDPQFLDADGPDNNPATFEDNDYHLKATSLCIDAGKNEPWMGGALDIDGNNRIWHGKLSLTVDMGAYEYGSFRFTIVNVERTPSGQVNLTWKSRPGDTYVITSTSGLLSPSWSQAGTAPSQGAETTWSGGSTTPSSGFFRIGIQ